MIRIPGYTLKKKLGVGGMATVYLAVQESLQREVAMKVMAPALAADRNFAKRFIGEARTIAELNHPNIVSIHDVGVTEEHLHYFAMQYCPGGDLSERIQKGVDEKELIRVLTGICGALSHAHKRGFVHRDVTPGNVLFDREECPVLTDFGIARVVSESTRMTATGLSLGTSQYMSPEQARGRRVDFRSDIYSLGAVTFEALTGEPPYHGDDSFSVAYAHVYDPVPELPERLKRWQTFVEGCMAKDPADRYQSMEEVSAVLQGFLTRLTGAGRRTPAAPDEAVEPAAETWEEDSAEPDATQVMPVQPPPAPNQLETPMDRLKWLGLAMGTNPLDWLRGLGTALRWGIAWLSDLTGGRLPLWLGGAALVVVLAMAGGWWTQRPVAEDPEPVVQLPELPPPELRIVEDPEAEEPMEIIASVEPDEPVLVNLDPDADSITDAEVEAAMTRQFRQRILDLLADANRFLEDNELTTPPRDNAFERFEAVMLLDPDNMQAREGMVRIVERYVSLSRTAISGGRYSSAMSLVRRGRRVATSAGIEAEMDAGLKSILPLGYDSALARAERERAAGDLNAAEEAYSGALLFRPGDETASQALANLWPEAVPMGPQVLSDPLANGNSGPDMVVVEEAGLAFGVTEVTVDQFRLFRETAGSDAKTGSCRHMESMFRASRKRTWENPGFDQTGTHPVVCVSWADATAYADWLTAETGFVYRLPTQAEWNLLLAEPDQCSANHGDAALRDAQRKRNVLDCDDGFSFSAPAGSFASSEQGAFDVSGNVREWAADCTKGNNQRCRGRAVMGTAWLDSSAKDVDNLERSFNGEQRFTSVGFRLVREMGQPVAGD
ncbi:MAG: protein kinase [Xanthomonadales bacterium]|nr:protein kinase [Xanthomonadales bacterium]